MRYWSEKTEIAAKTWVRWIGVSKGKYFDWKARYGKANEHNALVPRDHWIEEWERRAIIEYHGRHLLDGYRRLTFMMQDEDIVAVSPSTTYRVLRQAGLIDRWNKKASKKGTGFVQPLKPHEHWHIDVSYLNIGGTFFYLCLILDGFSRVIVHWEIRESMTEPEIECIVERGRERYPGVRPRIISDNGPQFISKDFKEYVRLAGMTHVRTAPYYPQSNGKLERVNQTIKAEAIRVSPPESLEAARALVAKFVDYYNNVRLHSAIGYIAPADMLAGRGPEIWKKRDERLETARERRRQRRLVEPPPSVAA